MNTEKIEQLAEIALAHEEGGNVLLWPVPDNEEERTNWKEVWKKGFDTAQSEIAKLKEENERLRQINLVAAVTRRGVFFIENKETQRWLIPKWGGNIEGDHQTSDPHKAQIFETILDALMTIKNEGFKIDQLTVTEHEFVAPVEQTKKTEEPGKAFYDLEKEFGN